MALSVTSEKLSLPAKCLMALLAGLLSSAIFPPFTYGIAAIFAGGILGFSTLIWLLESCNTWKKSAVIGWCFGFCHFLPSFYWIQHSLMTDPENYAWLVPFAVSLIPAAAAIYIAIICALYSRLPGEISVRKLLGFASLWVILELIRTYFPFGGFPWNLAGYALGFDYNVLQPAAYFGIYGLSFLFVFFSLAPTLLFRKDTVKYFVISLFLAVGVVYITAISSGSSEISESRPIVRIVQANIPVQENRNPQHWPNVLLKHLEMSQKNLSNDVSFIIWPESASSYFLDKEKELRQMIAAILPEKAILLTGSMRSSDSFSTDRKIWNSIQGIDKNANIVATYDKSTLVPFGEYVPFKSLLSFMDAMTMPGDFARGNGPKTIQAGNLPSFSPLICYEAIFPQRVVGSKRPEWLLNVTNDAWFGESDGPYQHYHMAQVRAIEQGLPLVRAANTGISAVFNGYGQVIQKMDINTQGVMDVTLPPALPPTIYSRYGDIPMLILISIFLLLNFLPTQKREI